jgi:hypothetical protein
VKERGREEGGGHTWHSPRCRRHNVGLSDENICHELQVDDQDDFLELDTLRDTQQQTRHSNRHTATQTRHSRETEDER